MIGSTERFSGKRTPTNGDLQPQPQGADKPGDAIAALPILPSDVVAPIDKLQALAPTIPAAGAGKYFLDQRREHVRQQRSFGRKIDCGYTAPNEQQPKQMLPMTKRAPAGVYVGVGTERAWIAAALNPHLTHLYLVDCDWQVVFYNSINAALIQAAQGNRKEYVNLRLHAEISTWIMAASTSCSPEQCDLLQTGFNWWRKTIAGPNSSSYLMAAFHDANSGLFEEANYLHDNRLFGHLSRYMATHVVHIGQVDLFDACQVETLTTQLTERDHRIAILDVSNAYDSEYLGASVTTHIVKILLPVFAPQGLLLGTVSRGNFRRHWSWAYFAARAQSIVKHPDRFARHLRRLDSGPRPPDERDINRLDAHLDGEARERRVCDIM